jgi:HEPN domain-containing protein
MKKHDPVEMWRRAERALEEARDLYESNDYPYCIIRAKECIELTLKAVFILVGEKYPKKHDVSKELTKISEKFPEWFKEKLAKIKLSSKLSEEWKNLAMYGDEELGLSPERIFNYLEAKLILKHAEAISSDFLRLLIEYKGK